MKTSFLLEKKWKGRYCKWARLHLMALAEGEEIGQGGKVLSIVLILANTFGYGCHVCGNIKLETRNMFSDRKM